MAKRLEQVTNPVAVRSGWANVPEVNLYNQEGLPASPFRTDDWKTQPPSGKPSPTPSSGLGFDSLGGGDRSFQREVFSGPTM